MLFTGPSAVGTNPLLGTTLSSSGVDNVVFWVSGVWVKGSSKGFWDRWLAVVGNYESALSWAVLVGALGACLGVSGVSRVVVGFRIVASCGGLREVGPGNFEVFPELFRGLKLEHFSCSCYVLSSVIGEVSWQDKEKAFRNDGVGEKGRVYAALDVLELGSEGFKSVEEVGGFFSFFWFTLHPFNFGVLE